LSDLISETSVPLAKASTTLAGEAAPAAPGWHRLGFAVQHQQQTQWCWAAVSVSIDDYYRKPNRWTQCKMVCSELDLEECCANGGSQACNRAWYLEKALERAGIFAGLEPVPTPTPGLPPSAAGDIEGGKPVGLRIAWDKERGHVIALEGFRADGARVAVEDPWTGASEFPVNLLNRYQGTGTLTHLFHTQP
jgi:Papain-like cysteine protease AvrRpt2